MRNRCEDKSRPATDRYIELYEEKKSEKSEKEEELVGLEDQEGERVGECGMGQTVFV
jgi:hypothetical protein